MKHVSETFLVETGVVTVNLDDTPLMMVAMRDDPMVHRIEPLAEVLGEDAAKAVAGKCDARVREEVLRSLAEYLSEEAVAAFRRAFRNSSGI